MIQHLVPVRNRETRSFSSLNRPIRDWQGKRVWIVGASTGIGAALARQLHAAGARLALSARNRDRLAESSAGWSGTLCLPLDVTEPGALERAGKRVVEAWDGIDMVVLNAGTYSAVRAWELDPDSTRRTVETNLLGVIDGVGAVLPSMLARGSGAIAVVGSVAGYRGLPNAIVYGATKSALINFCETLYLDLRPKGIDVFLVSPGFVDTPLTAQNRFSMPALISADEAARRIVAGFAKGCFEIHFPKRFTLGLKLLELLPYRLYFALVRRLTGL